MKRQRHPDSGTRKEPRLRCLQRAILGALLARPGMTSAQLADHTGRVERDIRSCIQRLDDRGLTTRQGLGARIARCGTFPLAHRLTRKGEQEAERCK